MASRRATHPTRRTSGAHWPVLRLLLCTGGAALLLAVATVMGP